MIRNYFKIAIRNLLRSKAFSIINISGLAIGMASAILILLWIQNELRFDRFHEKGDRIYMMYNRDKFNGQINAWNTTPKPLASALKQNYPEVEDAVRYRNVTFLMTAGEKKLNVQGAFTDSGFLSMFSYPLLKGNEATALNTVNSIVLTQKLAKKLFGNEEAMGRTLRIDSSDMFTITGILRDLPDNTKADFEWLLPWSYMTKIGWSDSAWGNNSVSTYALLKPGASQAGFDAKVKSITINHTKGTADASQTEVFTHSLNKLHLYSKSENGKLVAGRIERVRLFGIIAAFILLIACINFMNLSTARSEKRAKEVGIRKVAGAQKNALIFQFIGESILLATIAFVIAIVIGQLSLPGFNHLVDKQLYINFGDPFCWLFAIAFILFTGLIAGSYPAFYLSSFTPVKVLKGTFKSSHALVTPRKVLVVLQFTFAIILIISTIIVQRQIQYAQDRDAGYNKNNLVFAFLQGDTEKNYRLIKNDLINSGGAVAVTKSLGPVTKHWSDGWGFSWPGSTEEDKKTDFLRMSTDAEFVKTMGVKLMEGRDIDIYNYPTDSTAILLNETALKAMRLKDPIGQIVKADGRDWHIAGIINDFILESPYEKVAPMIIFGPSSWFGVMHFKLNPAHSTANNLAKAEKIFKQYNPQYPFEYVFVDESYAKKFKDEQRTASLAVLFAGLTIFISCLGLFGLSAYMAANRIKEIGVRKVLGASVGSITSLLSKDFLKLVIISFVFASPVAWWAMTSWLKNYSYRIDISIWVFAAAAALSIVVALATVSFQAIKAAISNPVKSLRTE